MTGSRLRTIVADDDDDLRDATLALLASRPEFDVIGSVSNGDDAVAIARQTPPDLVIIDVRMPNGGEALVARLHQISDDTTVVAFTAYDDPIVRQRMLDAGATEFVIKGATSDFAEVLRTACATRRP